MLTTLIEQASKLLGSAYVVSALTPWLIFWLANAVTLILALGPMATLRLGQQLSASTPAVWAVSVLAFVFLILGALLVASLTTVFKGILQGRYLGPPLGLFLRGGLRRMQQRAEEYGTRSQELFDEWMEDRGALEGLSTLTNAYARSTDPHAPKPVPTDVERQAVLAQFDLAFDGGTTRDARSAASAVLTQAYASYAATAFETQHGALFEAARRHTDDAREAYAAVERERTETFADARHVAPTDYGNAIAATEAYVWRVYGIESAVMWTRLQKVVPKEYMDVVRDTTVRLDFFTAMTLFAGTYGLIWFFVLPYLLPSVALLVALSTCVFVVTWIFYRAAVEAAFGFGEVFRAAFDLFRRPLLTALSLEPPATLTEERALWSRISSLMVFHHPPSTDDDIPLTGGPKAERAPVPDRFE